MFDDIEQLLDYDKKHIWHPYTSMTSPLTVYPVKSAQDELITLMDGRVLIDGMSSWWSAIHGYNNKDINNSIKNQVDELAHIMFGGITHLPAVELSKKLIEITPAGLNKVFLCDSGSVAVEVAMKMAIQYYYTLGKESKNRFLTIRNGYHGDTFHAMSVCDPQNGMHAIYGDVLPKYYFCDAPNTKFDGEWDENDIVQLTEHIQKYSDKLCAVILEPIVQGAGGMKFYHPKYLTKVKQLCSENDVLFIADEIATSLGRTGKLFACEHAETSPDIMCLGKTLTGGYLTLGATLCSDEVAAGISNGKPGVFMHGPTYMGNPLACKAAVTSIDILLRSNWKEKIRIIEEEMINALHLCRRSKRVVDVRVLGAIGVVEVDREINVEKIQKLFVERGVWIRPFGTLIYIMPPYTISLENLKTLTTSIVEVISEENGW